MTTPTAPALTGAINKTVVGHSRVATDKRGGDKIRKAPAGAVNTAGANPNPSAVNERK